MGLWRVLKTSHEGRPANAGAVGIQNKLEEEEASKANFLL